MKGYLAKKILEGLFTLFIVASVIFFLMHLAPGNPFMDEHSYQSESIEILKAHYGLDKPIWLQYLKFLKTLLFGDLGPSMSYENVNVSLIIKQAFPVSLKLGTLSFFLSILMGFCLSVCLVFGKNRYIKKIAWFTNSAYLALPSFVACVLLQYVFAIKLDLFPISGFYEFRHLILPALSLSLIPAGVIARLLKTKLEEVLKLPYTLSAKSKGIGPVRLFIFHLLPGAILPTLSYLGPLAATLITGSFACEKVFAIPGLGSWFVMSLNARDYPLIAGLTLFYTAFVAGFSLCADLLMGFIDPKLKVTKI